MDSKLRIKLLTLPFFFWFFLLVLGPFCLIVFTSFLHRSEYGIFGLPFELNSYRQLADPLYLEVFLRTLLLATLNTIFCVALSYPLAFFLSRLPKAQANRWIALIMIPFWTNFLLRVLAFMDVLRLQPFGLTLTYTQTGILLAMIYNYLPFALLPLYSTLEKVPTSVLEAAFDLGASKRHILLHVLWPLTRAGVVSAALLVFIPSLGEFLIPTIVGGAQKYYLGTFLENQFLNAQNWPLGSAAIVLILLASLILLPFVTDSQEKQA